MAILILLVLLMPFETSPYLLLSSTFLGVIPDFTVIKLVGLMGVVYSVFRYAATGSRIDLLGSRQARYFLLFVFVVLLSGLLNGVVGRPLSRLISIIALLPLLLIVVRREKDVVLVLQAAVGSLILSFPYGLRQSYRFGGGRYGVGLYEPNYLALALVLLLPLAVAFALNEHRPLRKWGWYGGAFVMLIATVLTGSRGGFIGLVVVGMALVMKLSKKRVAAMAAFSIVFLMVLALFGGSLLSRIVATADPNSTNTAVKKSTEARMLEIKGGLRMVRERPLTGVGLGNFQRRLERTLGVGFIAHNTYLEVAAELGMPALGVFLLTLLASYRSLSQSARIAQEAGARPLRNLALAMQAGLLGYMVSATFLSAQFEKFLWLTLFSTICLERVVRERARMTQAKRVPAPSRAVPSRWARPSWRHS